MDYKGESCVKCGKTFDAGDDVVVCPDCGSPHHRSCYTVEGRCANADKHAEGFRWARVSSPPPKPAEPYREDPDTGLCPKCGFPNDTGDVYCAVCGTLLPTAEELKEKRSVRFLGFDPEEKLGGAAIREVAFFISSNLAYYLPTFKRMKVSGTKVSLNPLCFLFPPVFFANRRMWGWAIVSTVIMVLLGLPTSISTLLAGSMEADAQVFTAGLTRLLTDNRALLDIAADICGILQLVLRVVMCLFADWLYLRFVVKSLNRTRLRTRHFILSDKEAAAGGGVKPLNCLLIVLIFAGLSYAAMIGASVLLEFAVAFLGIGG